MKEFLRNVLERITLKQATRIYLAAGAYGWVSYFVDGWEGGLGYFVVGSALGFFCFLADCAWSHYRSKIR